MTDEIKVPVLGANTETATVARWLKKAGDEVAADEPLLELETDKITVEVNAPGAGLLQDVSVAEGAEVEVGDVLARIARFFDADVGPGDRDQDADQLSEEDWREVAIEAAKQLASRMLTPPDVHLLQIRAALAHSRGRLLAK